MKEETYNLKINSKLAKKNSVFRNIMKTLYCKILTSYLKNMFLTDEQQCVCVFTNNLINL
jgi:hypothetical protein